MSGRTIAMRFVDTNVLLYAISSAPAEASKAGRASELLNSRDLALSVQVLQEFYVQATRAGATAPISPDDALALIGSLATFPVLDITPSLMQSAIVTHRHWKIGYWDAAIVEAARALGCETILTEDLQHGQDFGGVHVVNPFR